MELPLQELFVPQLLMVVKHLHKPFATLILKFAKPHVFPINSVPLRVVLMLLLVVPIAKPMVPAELVPMVILAVPLMVEKLQVKQLVNLVFVFSLLIAKSMPIVKVPKTQEETIVKLTINALTVPLDTPAPPVELLMEDKHLDKLIVILPVDCVLTLVQVTPNALVHKVLTAWTMVSV